jgi:hypothetical protein
MTSTPGKAPKKEKVKRQTAEERLEGIRQIHMMYGPTAGEQKLVTRKINLGTTYLAHPKFQSLMLAFRKGESFQFNVTDKNKNYIISTDGTHILFDGKIIYYSRPLNRYEDNLLMDKVSIIQYQTTDALIHLAVAVIRSLPELGTPKISYVNHKIYYGSETLEAAVPEQGPNLLIGSYRHKKVQEGIKK